jgi:hypothetical protein
LLFADGFVHSGRLPEGNRQALAAIAGYENERSAAARDRSRNPVDREPMKVCGFGSGSEYLC